MSAPARLAAFSAILVAVLAAGAGLGAAVGPDPAEPHPVTAETEGDACDPDSTPDMEHGSP